jgi:GntR family transcriptional regulator
MAVIEKIIDKRSKIPYYYQLADILREMIKDTAQGKTPNTPATLMPSEAELAKIHRISRATARQAFDLLEREGLIYREKGKGTFAATVRNRYNLTTLISTTADIVRRGWVPSVQVVSLKVLTPPQPISAALRGAEEVYELCRVRLGNNEPISIQWSYVPVDLCPGLTEADVTGSLTQLLETRYGVRPWTAHEILRARLVTATEAKLLQIAPKSPVIYMERTTYSPAETPIEFMESVWRSDKYDFEFSLSRGEQA